MSDTSTKAPSRSFTKHAVPLLIEYGQKLNRLLDKARLMSSGTGATKEYARQVELFKRLRAPATQLARQVSQQIEHARLDDLDRTELWLRLSEFEHALLSAEEVLINGK